jgi:tetratricopeptide (TPR) repeat protein
MRVAGWVLVAMASLMPMGSAAAGASDDGYKEGLAAVQAGKWDDAISALQKGSANQKNGMTCYLLAYAYAQKKDYRQTHTYAACALAAKPALAEPYAQDAKAYLGWSNGVERAASGGYHIQISMSSKDGKISKDLEKAAKARQKVDALGSPEAAALAAAAYRAANPCSDESKTKTPEEAYQCVLAVSQGAMDTVPEGPKGRLPPD